MIFIFLLALILFGPKKLPEIGREIGKFLAEFKRASNDFKSQIQSEIEKAGVDMPSFNQTGGQQSRSFTQTLLPPEVTTTIKEIDEAQERLMRAARLAFEAQSFTLRAPETPVVAQQALEAPAAAPAAEAETAATSPDQPGQPTTSANATEAVAAPLQSNPAVQSG